MSEPSLFEPSVVRAAEGEVIEAAGVVHLFKLTGRHTGGLLGVEEFVVGPGVVGASPHVHRSHDETFFVVEGELTVATQDGEIALGVGDLGHAPRGSLHGYRNAADTQVRALCLYTPPGYEQ